jgi:LmbE family N-acetylglucosaminyl deacetylase
VPFTIVAFHAHPDDEALLTGGTLARAAAEGHRVVLVTATAGDSGLTRGMADAEELARLRTAELHASAEALACSRVVLLGYPDSGSTGTVPPGSFAAAPASEVAERLAEVLREEQADVLTTYDENGGYGHPDHVAVHRAGALAARMAGTPVVLEASVDRNRLEKVARTMRRVPGLAHLVPEDGFAGAYLPRDALTHQVDVRAQLDRKCAALASHRSQARGGLSLRTARLLLSLPRPLRARVLGREWFREIGRAPGDALLDDIFASLRPGAPPRSSAPPQSGSTSSPFLGPGLA